jgi:hypothetical protein
MVIKIEHANVAILVISLEVMLAVLLIQEFINSPQTAQDTQLYTVPSQ